MSRREPRGGRRRIGACALALAPLGCGAPQVVGRWTSSEQSTSGERDPSSSDGAAGSSAAAASSTGEGTPDGSTGADDPESRDPFLWPFGVGSIWNRPIGDEAVYAAANLDPADQTRVEEHRILRVDPSDPAPPVFISVSPDDRCSGDAELELDLRAPDDWLVLARAGMNDFFTALLDDGDTLLQGHPIARCEVGGPLYLPDWMQFPANRGTQSIRGDGLDGGGLPPSGLSYLGGTIRLGELTSDAPIRHAIKFSMFARKYVHYSEEVPGFRWPARYEASGGASAYEPEAFGRVSDPRLVFGSLLAAPAELSPEDLELETVPGRKLFHALQDYGGYLVAAMSNDTWSVHAEYGVAEQVELQFGFSMSGVSGPWQRDLNRILLVLMIIDDNGPGSIGGAGQRRAPLAPPFE